MFCVSTDDTTTSSGLGPPRARPSGAPNLELKTALCQCAPPTKYPASSRRPAWRRDLRRLVLRPQTHARAAASGSRRRREQHGLPDTARWPNRQRHERNVSAAPDARGPSPVSRSEPLCSSGPVLGTRPTRHHDPGSRSRRPSSAWSVPSALVPRTAAGGLTPVRAQRRTRWRRCASPRRACRRCWRDGGRPSSR
jgi:hypothetical protein